MPMAPLRPCAQSGCPKLVLRGRCKEHERQRTRQYDSTPQRRGDHAFYASKAWKAVAAERKRLNPICQGTRDGRPCTWATREVDHVIPRYSRPDLELDINNTQGFCKSCHSRKTMREMRERRGNG